MRTTTVLSVCVAVAAAACALTRKARPLEVRYFSPEPAVAATQRGGAGSATASIGAPVAPGRLRIGQISSAANLRYEIVRRTSAVELEPYETLRWTERPDAYVGRAVSRALFDRGGLEQAVSGAAPTIDVDVIAFEEVVDGDHRAGRVSLRYRVDDERDVIASGVVTVSVPATGRDIDDVVRAIGTALGRAADQLADRVVPVVRGAAARSPDQG